MVIGDKVIIKSTPELNTKYNNKKGWIEKVGFMGYVDFCVVLTFDGYTNVFHISQIQVVSK